MTTQDRPAAGGTRTRGDATGGGPRVGVVVPVRDGEAHLAAALDSLLAQTSSDWCCVVVDDGSQDGTAAVARAYAEDARSTLVHHTGAGAGAARNRGMQELPASVEHLAFLDGDDTWVPDALERLTTALGADTTAVGVYGTAEYMDVDGRPVLPGAHPARQREDVVRRTARLAPESSAAQRWTAERAWRAVQHRRVARTAARALAGARQGDRAQARDSLRQLAGEAADLVLPARRTLRRPAPADRRDASHDPVVASLGGPRGRFA